VVQNAANLEPGPAERSQETGPHDRGRDEESRQRKRPQARTAPRHQGPERNDRENGGEHQAEGAIGGGFDLPGSKLSWASIAGLYARVQPERNLTAAGAPSVALAKRSCDPAARLPLSAAFAGPSTCSRQIKWLRNTYGTDSVRS
jgi:hypothetical protein